MRKGIWLAALLLSLGGSVEAATFELNFNDSSAQVGYAVALAEDDFGRSLLNGRLLFNDKEETLLGSFGAEFAGAPGNVPGLDLGVGAQVFGGRTDESRDLLGLGVGGRLDYAPPVLGGVGVGVKAFYAPEIFSWLDIDRLVETGVRLSYAATPRVRLHLEFQTVRADMEDRGTWTIDEGVRAGFQARF